MGPKVHRSHFRRQNRICGRRHDGRRAKVARKVLLRLAFPVYRPSVLKR